MAINPATQISPSKIDTSDPTGYPFGKAQDILAPGDGKGTPRLALVVNDIFGFQQALLKGASPQIVPSGTPDKVGASQYLEALINIIVQNVPGSGDNVGKISLWGTNTPPSDSLQLDGTAYSRTTYADLFALWGTTYGVGDGSTTFNVPDWRGLFPRIWDNGAGIDPDAGARTDSGGGVTGDNVGSKQLDDQNAEHFHVQGLVKSAQTMRFGFTDTGINAGAFDSGSTTSGDDGANTSSEGGAEARPKNVYAMAIVKF